MRFDLLAAVGFFVVSGCLPETGGNTKAAGASPGEEELPEWQGVTLVDELWKVGLMDGPEYEVLGEIADAVFIGTGLAVSDSHSNRIHWYDGSGKHKVSAGGSGGGPGEFIKAHSLDLLPDRTLAVVDASRTIEFFSEDGKPKDNVLFPGRAATMCIIDSTLVVLGALNDSDLPIHLMDLPNGVWTSIGSTGVPETESRHRRVLVLSLVDGAIGCVGDRIVYARSSDGSVRALNRDGSELWEVEIPSFVSMEHVDDGERGIRHGPPEGATEVHEFHSVSRFGQTVAVQILRYSRRTREIPVTTVFLDLASGQILGKDDSLPMIIGAREDRVAVARETPIPEIAVYSISHR